MTEPHRTPRWVIGFAIAAAVLVVAFVVLHLAGGGFNHRSHRKQHPSPGSSEGTTHRPPHGHGT